MFDGHSNHRRLPIWLVLGILLLFPAACCKPPVKINLISDATVYEPGAPIGVQVRVVNVNTDFLGRKQPVVARRGFFDQDFHLRLTIIGPDGQSVAQSHPGPAAEPAPPYRSGDRFLVPVEIIAPEAENIYFMKDLRDYYRLEGAGGWYSAQVRASLETFCRTTEATSGALSGELLATCNRSYNPLVSNKIRFEILPEKRRVDASVIVSVLNVQRVADRRSDAANRTLEYTEVRLYRIPLLPEGHRSTSRKAFPQLWNQVQPQASSLTDARGRVVFSGIEQDDYLVLARNPALAQTAILDTRIERADDRWQADKVVDIQLTVRH